MEGSALRPPGELRPAQLGLMLVGRVLLGHIGATVADLAARGYLRMEVAASDWVLTDERPPGSADDILLDSADDVPLDYELELLDGLFDGRGAVALSDLGDPFVGTLDRVRHQLIRDAVRNGRLSRWGNRRTRRGEQLLAATGQFRGRLRAAAGAGSLPSPLEPYAMAFGLGSAAPPRLAGPAADDDRRRELGPVPESSRPSVPAMASVGGWLWTVTCSRLVSQRTGRDHRHWSQQPAPSSLAAYHHARPSVPGSSAVSSGDFPGGFTDGGQGGLVVP
jgi:hypothetical protein